MDLDVLNPVNIGISVDKEKEVLLELASSYALLLFSDLPKSSLCEVARFKSGK
jgi:hypothetical protein